LWNGGDYGFRQGLQNLLFPEGVSFNKKTGDYRTMRENVIAERISVFSGTCGKGDTKRDCDFHQQSRIVECELELSNEYVRQYQSFVRFIEDNIIYLDSVGF
jgi:hypothetical protein